MPRSRASFTWSASALQTPAVARAEQRFELLAGGGVRVVFDPARDTRQQLCGIAVLAHACSTGSFSCMKRLSIGTSSRHTAADTIAASAILPNTSP